MSAIKDSDKTEEIKPTHKVIDSVWLGDVQWLTGDLLVLENGKLHRIVKGKKDTGWLNPLYVSKYVKSLASKK